MNSCDLAGSLAILHRNGTSLFVQTVFCSLVPSKPFGGIL